MGDRSYVSVSIYCDTPRGLEVQEDLAYRMLANGDLPASLADVDMRGVEDDHYTADPANPLAGTFYYGVSEVSLGWVEEQSERLVGWMRNGTIPKRSFSVMQDGPYGDQLGYMIDYDAVRDRLVHAPAMNGEFQIGLDDLVRRYNDHNRDADAMMRSILNDYNVRLKQLPSSVVAIIERINKNYMQLYNNI